MQPKLPDIYKIGQNVLYRKNVQGNSLKGLGLTILDSLKELRVEYHVSGDFTTAILLSKDGEVFSGTSKRSRKDKQNPFTGKSFALTRAMHSFIMNRIGIDNPPNQFVIK